MSVGRYPGGGGLSTAETGAEASGRIARSAGVVATATLASRVLGLVRDITLANLFAPGRTDAFFIAFMIPNLFRRLVGEGSLTVSLVPVFTEELQRSRQDAARFFRATWTLAALVGGGIAILGAIFADPLVRLFAPGFAGEPQKLALTVELLRLCFPYIWLLTLVAAAMGALNALGHFFAPAIAPVLLNLSLLAGAAAGFAWMDPPILALGWAVLAAGLLQVAAQIGPLLRLGMEFRPRLALGDPAVRKLVALMLPALLGASVFQLNLVVSRLLASFFGDGAVSYLYYAARLIEFPLGVFVFAIGTASLPAFSRLAAAEDREGLRQAFGSALGLTLALVLPSTVGLILLREPIFAVLFGWNPSLFGQEAMRVCSLALLFYALGLAPVAVARQLVALCAAHHDTRIPARGALVGLGVNVIAALLLIGPLPAASLPGPLQALRYVPHPLDLDYLGLALASSIAAAANLTWIAWSARRRYGRLLPSGTGGRVGRLLIASGALAGFLALTRGLWPMGPAASLRSAGLLTAQVGLGGTLYLATLWLLGSPEWRAGLRLLRREV
ncbi:MAG: murein biosynthesis integral membrane protein MurJ [Myxococcota bacterium]